MVHRADSEGGVLGRARPWCRSDRHLTLDARVRVVADHLEVLDRVVEDALRLARDLQLRQRPRLSRQLQLDLLEVVRVDVHVTTRPDELADLQIALLCDHVDEQRVAGDVEGHAQEHVTASLVQLAGQLAVGHVELEERVTGRQQHLVDLGGVPGRDDEASRVRVRLDLLDQVRDLVDGVAVGAGPAAPLDAVDRAQVAEVHGELLVRQDLRLERRHTLLPLGGVLGGDGLVHRLQVGLERPLRPDVDVLLEQRPDVALAGQEPEQLLGDEPKADPLAGDEGEPLGQVVADLTPEDADGARTGAVGLRDAVVEDISQEVFVCGCGHTSPKNEGPSD